MGWWEESKTKYVKRLTIAVDVFVSSSLVEAVWRLLTCVSTPQA